MNSTFHRASLGDLLNKSEVMMTIDPAQMYKQVTVKLWGKGVVLREEIDGNTINSPKQYVVKKDQFILSKIDARNGAFGLVPAYLDGAIVSSDFPVFDLDTTCIIPEYLEWMSKTKEFVNLCIVASEGTTNRVRLKLERFLTSTIPLPPIQEQRRIVARIEELAGKIEEARGLREELSKETFNVMPTIRAQIFDKALEKKSSKLIDVAIVERGKFSHRPRNDPYFFGGNHPWIQIAEIESSGKYIERWFQTLNEEGLKISKKFPKGTLLMSIAATIGSVGILNFDCCIPDSIVAITPRQGVSSEYLYHYFGYLRNHLEKIAPQSAQKNINIEILSSLPVPLLDTIEQQEIVDYLDNIQELLDSLDLKQTTSNTEIDSLLPAILDKAFKGEL